jgi:hypothetical protein
MIESVVLNSHTFQTVSAVKFGWIIISEEDFKAKKNLEAARVRGYSPLYDFELYGRAMKRMPVYIDFMKEAKPLIKEGILSGTFYIRIRVSEVHFKDGTAWAENDLLASKKYSHVPSRLPQLPNCPNTRCNFHENGQGYCNEITAVGYKCLRHAHVIPPIPTLALVMITSVLNAKISTVMPGTTAKVIVGTKRTMLMLSIRIPERTKYVMG